MKKIKPYKIVAAICFIGLLTMIWGFSAQDSVASSDLSNKIGKWLANLLYKKPSYSQITIICRYIRKVAHFSEFMLLGLCGSTLILNSKKPYSAYFALPFTVIAAMGDEFHQRFVAGRGPSFIDVAIDTSGALLGISIVFLIAHIVVKRSRRT